MQEKPHIIFPTSLCGRSNFLSRQSFAIFIRPITVYISPKCPFCLYGVNFFKPFITLQFMINDKPSWQSFWHCCENELVKKIPWYPTTCMRVLSCLSCRGHRPYIKYDLNLGGRGGLLQSVRHIRLFSNNDFVLQSEGGGGPKRPKNCAHT